MGGCGTAMRPTGVADFAAFPTTRRVPPRRSTYDFALPHSCRHAAGLKVPSLLVLQLATPAAWDARLQVWGALALWRSASAAQTPNPSCSIIWRHRQLVPTPLIASRYPSRSWAKGCNHM